MATPEDRKKICNSNELSSILKVPDLDLMALSNSMCKDLEFGNLITGAYNMLAIEKVVQKVRNAN